MSELPEKQVKRLRALITEAETNLAAAKELLISVIGDEQGQVEHHITDNSGQVIEGIFDGQSMVALNGKNYPISANYASKSKLVEGDTLKLTITDEGKLLYKQIGPVDRKQVIGTLIYQDGLYYVEVAGKEYRILLASVTYFKLEIGSQVTVILPADNPEATWAAVEAKL